MRIAALVDDEQWSWYFNGMRPSTTEKSSVHRSPIRCELILAGFVALSCGSSSHSMDDMDGGHSSDAHHVEDVGDASSTSDGSTDSRLEDGRCGDGTFDARDERRCDRD